MLGKEIARKCLLADVELLGLPPAQLEFVFLKIQTLLHVPDDQLAVVRRLVAHVPAVLHMHRNTLGIR